MNLIAYAPTWLTALLAAALIAAAIEDMIRLRISNITVVVVLAGAIAAMAFGGFRGPLWQNAVVFAAILAVGTLMFARNLLGGGDVKLFAATGLWVNFTAALALLVMIFLAGGAVALVYILVRKVRGIPRREASRIPYGVAIAAGALYVFGTQYAHSRPDPNFHPLPSIKGVKAPHR